MYQASQFPGNLCNVTWSSREKQNNCAKSLEGFFVFGWLKCSELFKSWKSNNKPHPQRAPVWIPPLVYCFPIQNFSVLMRIKENSNPQNGMIYSEPAQNIKLLKHNLVKAHWLSCLLYTSLFMDIQVLLASSQGKKAHRSTICGF